MTLEESILELTSITPSGGYCRLGEASFKVWYCADIWEWEFLGETYFDALDLATAMVQRDEAVLESSLSSLSSLSSFQAEKPKRRPSHASHASRVPAPLDAPRRRTRGLPTGFIPTKTGAELPPNHAFNP